MAAQGRIQGLAQGVPQEREGGGKHLWRKVRRPNYSIRACGNLDPQRKGGGVNQAPREKKNLCQGPVVAWAPKSPGSTPAKHRSQYTLQ